MGFAIPEVIINLAIVWIVLMVYFMGWTGTKEILFRRKSLMDPEVGLEEEKMELKVETVCKEAEEKEEVKTEVDVSVEDRVEAVIREKYESLGPASFHEVSVLVIFSSLVIVWFLRKPGFLPGWAEFLQWTDSKDKVTTIGSATPTILAVILLFVVPADPRKNPSGP